MTAEDKMRHAIGWIIFGAVLFVVGIIGIVAALADEPHQHRPQDLAIHHKFYKHWKMPDNRAVSCCNEDDCRPAEAYLRNGQWYARQEGDDGDFTPIPKHKVDLGLPDSPDNPDGRNHLCGRRYGPRAEFTTYCFQPAAGY
jgi:hypothetical protein